MYRYNTYILKCIITCILIRSSYQTLQIITNLLQTLQTLQIYQALQIHKSFILGVKLMKTLATTMQTTFVSTKEKGFLHNVSFGIQNMIVFTFLKL